MLLADRDALSVARAGRRSRGLACSLVLTCASWALGTIACLPAGEPIDWPEGDYIRRFVVLGSANGLTPPELLAMGSGSENEQLVVAQSRGQELYFLGFDAERLAGLHPDLDLDRLDELTLELRPSAEVLDEACAEIGVLRADQTITWALGDWAEAFVFDGAAWQEAGSASALANVGFRAPIRDRCSALSLSWRPYGARSPYFTSADEVGGVDVPIAIKNVVGLSPGHLLATIDPGLLSVRRGQPYVPDGGHRLGSDLLPALEPGQYWTVAASAWAQPGSLLVAATLKEEIGRADTSVSLFELEVQEDTFGESNLIFSQSRAGLDMRGLTVGRDGRYVAIAKDLVVTATAAWAPPQVLDLPGLDAGDVAYEPDADPSLLIGGNLGIVWAGEPGALENLVQEQTGVASRVGAVAFADGIPYAATNLFSVFRREEEGWKKVEFFLPESVSECTEERRTCGRAVPGQYGVGDLVGLDDGSGRLLLSFERCGTVIVVEPRPIEACVAALSVPFEDLAEQGKPDVDSISIVEGNAVITGNGGMLIEVVINE